MNTKNMLKLRRINWPLVLVLSFTFSTTVCAEGESESELSEKQAVMTEAESVEVTSGTETVAETVRSEAETNAEAASGEVPADAAASPEVSAEVTDEKAVAIIKKVSELTSIDDSSVAIDMRVFRRKELSKAYKIRLLYKNSDHSLSETLSPPRSKGEIMLHSGDSDWLFLPRINKVIRVSMNDSFSNSDFSNLDVMDTDFSKDYIPRIVAEEEFEEHESYKVELTAKTDSSSYAKVIMWVRKSDYFVPKREYYTYSGHLIKEMALYNKNDLMGGMPDTFIMTSALEKDKFTILMYTDIQRNRDFPEETFHKSSLVKR